MSNVEVLAMRASDGLRILLGRLAMFVLALTVSAAFIGLCAWASGLLVSDGAGWRYVGFVLCMLPTFAAGLACWRIWRTQRIAPRALDDLRVAITDRSSAPAVDVLIDMDTGQRMITSSRSLTGALQKLDAAGGTYPALTSTLRAVTSVPWLVALAIVGTLIVGAVGTVLLLIGLLG